MAGTPMRHAPLSNEQILQALSKATTLSRPSQNIRSFSRAASDFQKMMRRIELMAASMTVLEKIRTKIRALEHELDRRED